MCAQRSCIINSRIPTREVVITNYSENTESLRLGLVGLDVTWQCSWAFWIPCKLFNASQRCLESKPRQFPERRLLVATASDGSCEATSPSGWRLREW